MGSFKASVVTQGVQVSQDELTEAKPLAQGAFSTLWRTGADGKYVIKCFLNDAAASAREEFETLSKLNDCRYTPNVYCLGTYVDDEGIVYPAIIESFVKGISLEQAITGGFISGSNKRKADALSASEIALEIAKALSGIAEHGVSHGNLSPAHIILAHDCITQGFNGGVEIVLVDFTRERLAAIPYGAPEVFGGEFSGMRNCPECDIWSLGAIVAAMIAGECWPESINDLRGRASITQADLHRIAEAKRQPLDLVSSTHLRPKTEAERSLYEIVLSCTMYNPNLRPSLTVVMKEMERMLDLKPVLSDMAALPKVIGQSTPPTPRIFGERL